MKIGDTVRLKHGDRTWARQYGLAEYYGTRTSKIHMLVPGVKGGVMLTRPLAGRLFWNAADLDNMTAPDANCITLPDGDCVGGLMAGKERCMHDA